MYTLYANALNNTPYTHIRSYKSTPRGKHGQVYGKSATVNLNQIFFGQTPTSSSKVLFTLNIFKPPSVFG